MTDLWRQQKACENAAGGAREHRAISQVPPKTGARGAATGRSGFLPPGAERRLRLFISIPLPPAGTRNKTKFLPYEIPRVRKT